jgi:hypothetical protein
MQLTESHSVCAQVIDRSVNWSVVESLSQPTVSQSDLSPPVCHKSLTLSLSHAAWLSLCHPSNYQSVTIFATSSNIRSVAQSVCNQSRVISLSYVSYHGKSCAVHVVVTHAVYLSRALEMSIRLTLTLSVALILSRALSTRTQICLSMTHLCVYHSHSCWHSVALLSFTISQAVALPVVRKAQ